uniref:Uncharacterized protein n=1 Tax=Aegilops tauschii subsp. strangulata TaxID=200361 RepID=A0A453IEX8_AEGTS
MFGENQECCAQFATRTARNDNGRSFGIYVRDANEIFPVYSCPQFSLFFLFVLFSFFTFIIFLFFHIVLCSGRNRFAQLSSGYMNFKAHIRRRWRGEGGVSLHV